MFKVFLLYILILLLLPVPGLCGYIGQMKAERADGEMVSVCGVVTASCNAGRDPWTYVEDEDGSAGILVYGFAGVENLYCATPDGMIFTDATGERAVILPYGSLVPHTKPERVPGPLMMPNRCVGGGDFMYNPNTGQGQMGIEGCCGLNNIGLLIKTTGWVTWAAGTWFTIDDGSTGWDTASDELLVYCGFMPVEDRVDLPLEGDYVSVVGISTCISQTQPVIIPMRRYHINHLSVFRSSYNSLPLHHRANPSVVTPPALEVAGIRFEAPGAD